MTYPLLQVKIVSADPKLWYADHIGETFTVVPDGNEHWRVYTTSLLIVRTDARMVS